MAECFIGEVRLFAGPFAPNGWMFCDGSLLPVAQYTELFSLLGTIYGGDGRQTFALPDLRSRVPVSQGGSYPQGEIGGYEQVTLAQNQMPVHRHAFRASSAVGKAASPGGSVPAATEAKNFYTTDLGSAADMAAASIGQSAGQSKAHDNMQPWMAINYIIAWQGNYPPRN